MKSLNKQTELFRTGEIAESEDSDHELVRSDESDSDGQHRSHGPSSGSAAPSQKRQKKKASSNKKKSNKKRIVTTASKKRIIEMMIKVSDLEMQEALEWLKESLSDAIEDYEVENNEGIPLVPVMDYAETAMENADFQQMLKGIGISPPFDEQEMYWRISSQIKPDELRSYCELIQQAIDKTLQIEDQTQEVEEQHIIEDKDSSDDEDVFSKLRKLAKPKNPQPDEITTQADDEKESDSKKSLSETQQPEVRKKSRIQSSISDSEDDEEIATNSEGQNDLREDDNGNNAVIQQPEVKRKFRIQASIGDSEDDEENDINPEEQNNLHEGDDGNHDPNHSTSFRHALDSDSDEENGENRRTIKRIRSASDSGSGSDPEKPKAKKGKIIDSDEDD
ncbi:hypothetical protein GWI33_015878 [Rhynchophorus ferrugineus]|uniref:Timeless C-terminal domain-containing protein n=1 Tax=Rhynchophorus ferrugineus TaxID=354439 RepID=A0A834M7N7_RHYFE|nr:hypothetical protein GWI33_015878 [Rhynchophorus ferrugineus]